jgi:hypothetical protein
MWRRVLWRIEVGARRFSREIIKGERRERPDFFDPTDVRTLGEKADAELGHLEARYPIGSKERGREILRLIGRGFPTPFLQEAYFANLNALLASQAPLASPGRVVLGLGTGRSGSTSLAALLGRIDNSCSTHENPPLVFLSPRPEQMAFHLRRFVVLMRYYALAADCAHWWLYLVDELVRELPNVKFVGTVRERSSCTASFALLKGFGRGTYNHWAQHMSNLWRPTVWDPTYPKFETPAWANRDPDRAKWEMIEQYIDWYNAKMAAAAARYPDKFLVLPTESLSDPDAIAEMYAFIGMAPPAGGGLAKMNVRSTKDGQLEMFRV